MRDVVEDVDRWRASGEKVALATVVSSWGSAPRRAGAKMAVSAGGGLSGSVSGGCVEGAVAAEARAAIADGRPRLLHFGVADETAWSVGLACGGKIDVFVAPLDDALYGAQREALREDRAVATATVIDGEGLGRAALIEPSGRTLGSLGGAVEGAAREAALDAVRAGECRRQRIGAVELFFEPLLPPPTLVIVGGVHVAVALVALARTLGYRTVVVDPRRAFGSAERFAHADRLLDAWPDEALGSIAISPSTAVAVLSHDPKLDDPALLVALRSPAFYVGALGSTKTQAKRRARLQEAGLGEVELGRLHAPIGLPLGGRAPEEIALAVMAQIVSARHGRS
ncbi:MAG TPA: XdhC/CoxI family protein [Vicinamibacteria bacterium]|nr:XdhC/CoxI family protein [Vicinamibacteria bacterium]